VAEASKPGWGPSARAGRDTLTTTGEAPAKPLHEPVCIIRLPHPRGKTGLAPPFISGCETRNPAVNRFLMAIRYWMMDARGVSFIGTPYP